MQKTIFVVDDNGANLALAEEALEEQYRVITFSSAAKMFAVLGKVTPDLILLDIEMPEMDGFEALQKFKADSAHTAVPVLFMTATVDAAIEARGKELGGAGFITKPFYAAVLLENVQSHL